MGKDMDIAHDQLSLDGPLVSKNFAIRFKGAPGLAARRARKFYQLLRTEGGWRELTAKTPDDLPVKVYIDEDKNRRQRKIEAGARKLQRILRTSFPDLAISHRKRDATVTINLVPVARVRAPSPNDYTIEWNLQLVQDKNINRESMEAQFKEDTADAQDSIVWG